MKPRGGVRRGNPRGVAPSRERELKLDDPLELYEDPVVAPSRERELKLSGALSALGGLFVAPSRERELKPCNDRL